MGQQAQVLTKVCYFKGDGFKDDCNPYFLFKPYELQKEIYKKREVTTQKNLVVLLKNIHNHLV